MEGLIKVFDRKKQRNRYSSKPIIDIVRDEDEGITVPKGYKPNSDYIETKSKRFHLLLQPSLYKALKDRARAEERSINDLIHSILEREYKK